MYTHILVIDLSDAEMARASDNRALLKSGGGLEATKAACTIFDPLSGYAAADVREGFEKLVPRAMAETRPGCNGGTGAVNAGA